MGEVYRATDLTLGQPVALKFLPDTGAEFERMLERFQNEVRVARQVSHPNVCRVYDLGEFEGMPYMSMEYIDGEDLSSLLSRIGRLPADKALDIARKICAGLAAAHDKGVIHRDLKPANVMLDKRGNAIIMDFGLAAVTNELRGAEARSGSPAYQAPEQLRGEEVTAKSDIYALGLLLYELFTGRRAYEAKSIAELIRVQEAAQFVSMTSIAADVDPSVEKTIRRCLEPVPSSRPPSALSVSAALPGGDPLAAALAAGETPSPELVAAAGRTQGLALKYSVPMALALAAFLIAVPFVRRNHEIHSVTPLELSPDVLQAKIREFATAFGYPEQPVDRAYWMTVNEWVYGEGEKAARASANPIEELRRRYHAESPFTLNYREGPQAMVRPDGFITSEQPAPIVSGMIEAWINSTGELRRFVAVPSQLEASPAPVPVDTALLARATGLDLASTQDAAPQFTPLYAFDWHKSWKGKHPRLDAEIQLDVAAWHGKVTHLSVIWPGSTGGRTAAGRKLSARVVNFRLAEYAVEVLAFGIAGFLAIRNLRAGRGDRRGAFRLTAILFALRSIWWVCTAHWTAHLNILPAVAHSLANQLVECAAWWLMYIALEPSVRARWPRVLVSWNRVLMGHWNDPLVGTRVLQGAFTGMVLAAGILGYTVVQAESGRWDRNMPAIMGADVRGFVADLANLAKDSIEFGLSIVFAIFLLRALLKRDWLASVAAAAIMTIWEGISDSRFELLQTLFFFGVFAIIVFVVLRLGLVATMVVTLMANLSFRVPGAQDLSKWYEWTVIAYPLTGLLIVAWAFWQASGDEAMHSNEPQAT